jgi:hypothetical protein
MMTEQELRDRAYKAALELATLINSGAGLQLVLRAFNEVTFWFGRLHPELR